MAPGLVLSEVLDEPFGHKLQLVSSPVFGVISFSSWVDCLGLVHYLLCLGLSRDPVDPRLCSQHLVPAGLLPISAGSTGFGVTLPSQLTIRQ